MDTAVDIVLAEFDMCMDIAWVKRQVWESSYRGIYPDCRFDNFSLEKESEKFAQLIDSADTHLYVAQVDGKIVGYMAIGKNPRHPNSATDEIVLLSVLKEYQGKGIGATCFNMAKELLKKPTTDHFAVYCNKYNEKAQAFYEKMGCQVVATDPDHPDKSIPQIKYEYRY